MRRLVLLAPVLIACGASERSVERPSDDEVAEAVDILATWVALDGIDDVDELGELRSFGFTYSRARVSGAFAQPHATEALRVCGPPELYVVEGGFDATMNVQAVEEDGALRWGRRWLTLRRIRGRLRLTSDRFVIDGEQPIESRDVGRDRFGGRSCNDPSRGRVYDCIVLFLGPEGPGERLPYPQVSTERGEPNWVE